MDAAKTNDPILTLRPKFVPDVVRLEILFYAFLATFALTILGGVFIMLVSLLFGLGNLIPPWLGFFALLVACVILLPGFIKKTIQQNMASTFCHFYNDHLLYQTYQLLVFKRRGRIKYTDISDIAERSNLFQNKYNIGDVWVIAPNMPMDAGPRFPGIKIRNIKLTPELTETFERVVFKNDLTNAVENQHGG